MDMMVAGIDVSKDRLDVCVLPKCEAFQVSRDAKGIDELVVRLAGADLIAVEATGRYESIVSASLAAAGLPLVVVNPGQVRHYAQALGQRAKTDPIDARVIALFAAATKPQIRPFADEATRLLSALIVRRRQIIEMIVAEGHRARMTSDGRLKKSIARLTKALERELSDIDAGIDEQICKSPAWSEMEALLTSMPGVGPVTARTLIGEMPELGRLNAKQIAALAGLAPFTRQSGKWRGKSFTGGGRSSVRSALFLAAMAARRYNRILKSFADRLAAKGKPKIVVIVAVARKLLTILNAMIRDRQPWTEQNA
ncbi:MAG: IS110 family transposase [Hoeflea sp.]|uniref:IS110 family transposase n=1 Tax=Hoeflea sp. TaxID=1940281 RepID=UPI001DEA653A|nr:IS110 family transposase [Hoeflea sp.]MBU4530579.1 IS110 family transposase [Alphaproteobacteria bacterium]MBU4542293.1 IS110 family transposase [Alphaproteobacteria bacterium]MBU4551851.1 IS110 family transposase [Alphaproteobacteria bacterium]MBV1726322.1 IS110 family transposase [Hoeflea sp.]MBV1786192.1 IS110 family transposase [Hoeflea sp.]